MLKTGALYTNWIICSLFPADCQFLQQTPQTFQRLRLYYFRNIFTAFAVGLSGKKLNSKKSRKFFSTTVEFWTLS